MLVQVFIFSYYKSFTYFFAQNCFLANNITTMTKECYGTIVIQNAGATIINWLTGNNRLKLTISSTG